LIKSALATGKEATTTTVTVAASATTIPINIEDINYDGNKTTNAAVTTTYTTEPLHIKRVFDKNDKT